MTSQLTHAGKCGGDIFPETIDMFSIKTPSLIISPAGITLGVLEIQHKSSGGKIALVCSKCKETLPEDKYAEEVMVECGICHRKHSADKTFSSRAIPLFCNDCLEMMSGKKPIADYLKSILMYIAAPDSKSIKTVAELLKSKISI